MAVSYGGYDILAGFVFSDCNDVIISELIDRNTFDPAWSYFTDFDLNMIMQLVIGSLQAILGVVKVG